VHAGFHCHSWLRELKFPCLIPWKLRFLHSKISLTFNLCWNQVHGGLHYHSWLWEFKFPSLFHKVSFVWNLSLAFNLSKGQGRMVASIAFLGYGNWSFNLRSHEVSILVPIETKVPLSKELVNFQSLQEASACGFILVYRNWSFHPHSYGN
jgi:hypothetical protein